MATENDKFYKKERINEFESLFYGFSPRGFTDGVHNIVVDSWSDTVQEELLTNPHLNKFASDKKFVASITKLLFESSFLKKLSEFTDYALRYVFRVPDSVTLRIHEDQQRMVGEMVRTGEASEPKDSQRRCKVLEKKIVEKRFLLADLAAQIKEAEDVLSVFDSLEENLGLKEEECADESHSFTSPARETPV